MSEKPPTAGIDSKPPEQHMTARSLHIGLNTVDRTHYGNVQMLQGCENDATAMEEVARVSRIPDRRVLLGARATRVALRAEVREAAAALRSGDTFLLTFAGHGGSLPDLVQDENDSRDETWCMYDAQVVDDELAVLWGAFAGGVRVHVVSDSCHSGTVTQLRRPGRSDALVRAIPRATINAVYLAHKADYDTYLRQVGAAPQLRATVRLYAACQDHQLAEDGAANGAFTDALLRVWDRDGFAGDHEQFVDDIAQLLPTSQSPVHSQAGPRQSSWDRLRPFEISP